MPEAQIALGAAGRRQSPCMGKKAVAALYSHACAYLGLSLIPNPTPSA